MRAGDPWQGRELLLGERFIPVRAGQRGNLGWSQPSKGGGSPCARGGVHAERDRRAHRRVIPVRAGPTVCGSAQSRFAVGGSPCVRGHPRAFSRGLSRAGAIPVRAGPPFSVRVSLPKSPEDPPARGADSPALCVTVLTCGSSPCERGTGSPRSPRSPPQRCGDQHDEAECYPVLGLVEPLDQRVALLGPARRARGKRGDSPRW